MNPLIPIAVNLLPSLAKRLTGAGTSRTVEMVSGIVADVLQTDDPVEAELAAQDPAKAAELRIRLAEIEAEADAQRRETELATRESERQAQKDALDAALARMESQRQTDAERAAAQLRDLEARLASQSDARGKAFQAAQEGSIYQYGPLVISIVVTVGFFIILSVLIWLNIADAAKIDPQVLQIVNIGFGTLTAGFATVISFWLGSSDSSRQKEGVNVQLQAQRSAETREIFQRQTEATKAILERQSSQTAELIRQGSRASAPNQPAPSAAPARAKSAQQFKTCVDVIFAHEGGFADDPEDPGGPTNMGITQKTLSAWRGEPVERADIQGLAQEEAQQIYRANYWNALGCQDLPAGLDLALFDFGVHSGVRRAAQSLQDIVAVKPDGEIGPVTLGAVAQFEPGDLLERLREKRKDHLQGLVHFDRFGPGWMRRLARTHEVAVAMAADG